MTYYDIMLLMLMVAALLVFIVWLVMEVHYANSPTVIYSHHVRRRAVGSSETQAAHNSSQGLNWGKGTLATIRYDWHLFIPFTFSYIVFIPTGTGIQ
jgi:hypothetical protein